jgi:hypothetical protein
VTVVAGQEAIDALPPIGRWIFFGFPRKVVGGYDVEYAGISAFSNDGKILIETLDPPGSQRHYILKSSTTFFGQDTFGIQMKSLRYPVVRDAEQMRRMVQSIWSSIQNLDEEEEEENSRGLDKGLPVECHPKEFDEAPRSSTK